MPQFGHQDGFDIVSLITGPSHVLLAIRFGGASSASFELIKRPRVGTCDHEPLDESMIVEAIHSGVAAANARHGARLTVAAACYVEDDSPQYELFRRCAFLLASNAITTRPSAGAK